MEEPLKTTAFDYHLPKELIATHPSENRASSRLLVVDRASSSIEHAAISDFVGYVQPNDLCVFNNTRVMPARFYSNDGKKELLRLDFHDPLTWRCLVRPGKKLREGHTIEIGDAVGTVTRIFENGDREVIFDSAVAIGEHGKLALPHYMERESEAVDEARYQTVFAAEDGAIAAPTAGLHFTDAMVQALPHAFVTLHVGVGTFQPVREEVVTHHRMHTESYHLTAEVADRIAKAERILSVGTTVTHCGMARICTARLFST